MLFEGENVFAFWGLQTVSLKYQNPPVLLCLKANPLSTLQLRQFVHQSARAEHTCHSPAAIHYYVTVENGAAIKHSI